MKKILGVISGVITGYITYTIVKYALLMTGPFILGPMGISGPRAAANLEATAEILGFLAFVFAAVKIYRLVTDKSNKKIK